MSINFKSRFAEDINGMIELFVSLGYAENTYIPRAKSFDSFCVHELNCPRNGRERKSWGNAPET